MELGYGMLDGRAVARTANGVVDLAPLGFETVDELLAEGPAAWQATADAVRAREPQVPAGEPSLPVRVGDVVDFYASLDHATNMGRILRPGAEPLPANWRHLPAGYHTRAGGVAVSGTPVRRPAGLVVDEAGAVVRRPTAKLDFELEVGFVVGGDQQLFGAVLVNDWSARDIQAFEYQPLGPLLGKSFLTTISAWIVPVTLLPRVPGPRQEPAPDPVLAGIEPRGFDVELHAELNGTCVTRTNLRHLYWSADQMLAHLTSNGSRLRPGDVLATGTVSGPTASSRACLMERSWNGTEPIVLADGSCRTFLEDGDTVVLRSPVLGECVGTVEAA